MLGETVKIFVYGTLMRGGQLAEILHTSQYKGSARISGSLFDTTLGFPALTDPIQEGDTVEGEVYEVKSETLRRLDTAENVPHLYERITTVLLDEPIEVFVYRYVPSVAMAHYIPSGKWT